MSGKTHSADTKMLSAVYEDGSSVLFRQCALSMYRLVPLCCRQFVSSSTIVLSSVISTSAGCSSVFRGKVRRWAVRMPSCRLQHQLTPVGRHIAACSTPTHIDKGELDYIHETPSTFIKTSCTILTNLTVLLPQSRDCSCYVGRPILASPPLWLHKHTDLRAHDFAHSPTCDISLGPLTFPSPVAGDFVE